MSYITLLTEIHTALSLIALALGIAAIAALFKQEIRRGWITWFIAGAWATTLTGFLFPFTGFTPAVGTGVAALIVLIVMAITKHIFHLSGKWSAVYRIGIVISEYLLVFVAIAQTFLKIEVFNNLAPTLSEPPFAAAQLVAIALFAYIGFKAVHGKILTPL